MYVLHTLERIWCLTSVFCCADDSRCWISWNGLGDEPESTAEKMRDAADEVVISGLSGRLPESDNIAEFREHLINGQDMITDDDRRWEPGELKYAFNTLIPKITIVVCGIWSYVYIISTSTCVLLIGTGSCCCIAAGHSPGSRTFLCEMTSWLPSWNYDVSEIRLSIDAYLLGEQSGQILIPIWFEMTEL